MDQNTALHLAKRYADTVTSEMQPDSVILFGSYAKGNFKEGSDIDVAVVFKDFEGDILKTSARLWRLTYAISDDIEPILLDSADDRSGFAKHVMRTGHVLYKAAA